MAIGSITPFRPTGTVSLSATTSSSHGCARWWRRHHCGYKHHHVSRLRPFWRRPIGLSRKRDMPVLANSRVMLSANSLVTHTAAMLVSGTGACPLHPRRRILRLMAFSESEKTDIRRFCGTRLLGRMPAVFRAGTPSKPLDCWNYA